MLVIAEADHVSICFLSHQSAESDDGSDAGEEEEDGGCDALDVDSVFEVAQEVAVTVLHVLYEATEYPTTETG